MWNYWDIEDEVMERQHWLHKRTNIEWLEYEVQKAELDALLNKRFKAQATKTVYIEHIYYTDGGERKVLAERRLVPDWIWIKQFIRQRMVSKHIMLDRTHIEYLLRFTIDDVYRAADCQNVPVRVENRKNVRKLFQSPLQSASKFDISASHGIIK